MAFLKKIRDILRQNKQKNHETIEPIEPIETIEIIDKRMVITPLDQVDIVGDDDPVMKAVLNAVWTGDDHVSASFEDGKLTIRDLPEKEQSTGERV
jgi:uncharacterized protein (UPF0210 family)